MNSRDKNDFILIVDLLHYRVISSLFSSVISRYKLYVKFNRLLPSFLNLTGCRSIVFLYYRCGGVYAILGAEHQLSWIGFTFCAFNLNWMATLSVRRKLNLTTNYSAKNIYMSQLNSLCWQPNKQWLKYTNSIRKTMWRGKNRGPSHFPRIANGLQLNKLAINLYHKKNVVNRFFMQT